MPRWEYSHPLCSLDYSAGYPQVTWLPDIGLDVLMSTLALDSFSKSLGDTVYDHRKDDYT